MVGAAVAYESEPSKNHPFSTYIRVLNFVIQPFRQKVYELSCVRYRLSVRETKPDRASKCGAMLTNCKL